MKRLTDRELLMAMYGTLLNLEEIYFDHTRTTYDLPLIRKLIKETLELVDSQIREPWPSD